MNTIWSTCVQTVGTLYLTRSLRFSDHFREKYMHAFAIGGHASILEIGCGPGALCESLHRWYPDAAITGIDRDDNFIEFAANASSALRFMSADAAALPFDDGSFDVTISNTVQEHIEPTAFFGEQRRVLKDGGVCLVLSARRGINIQAPCIAEVTDFEKKFYAETEKYYVEAMKKYNVCAYPMNEAELPAAMQRHGFRSVSTDYITVNLTPDNPVYDQKTAHAMINANRQVDLDSVDYLPYIAPGVVSDADIAELKRIKNAKYDKRLELYDAGIRQWDTNMSLTMVVRGIK